MLRRRGPGLLRTAATTAVIAGTATAVSNRVSRNQSQRYYNEDQQRYAAQEAQQPTYAPPPPPQEPEYMAELERLAQLKSQGILTEEEFQSKKKQLLGI
jgi:hypothetical protein